MSIVAALKIILGPALRPIARPFALLGLLLSSAIVYLGFFEEAPRNPARFRYMLCRMDVHQLAGAVEKFKKDCGKFPDSFRDLIVNDGAQGCRGPYLEKEPTDPWGRPFVYLRGSNNANPKIVSYGADGKPGGTYFDADISNRDLGQMLAETPDEKRAQRIRVGIWVSAWICAAGCIVVLTRGTR